MTRQQKQYFDNMLPGATLTTSDVRDPTALIQAGREYIEQGGLATFSDDYTVLTKCSAIPPTNEIRIYIDSTLYQPTEKNLSVMYAKE